MTPIEAASLKRLIHAGGEVALIDVREHGQYGEAHLLLAVSLPYSRLELDAPRLVPRRDVPVVLIDDESLQVAALAARRLAALGYRDLRVLAGGVQAWQRAGLRLFAGVNVPSKVFGELAEQVFATPHLSAQALQERLSAGEKLVVLDGRPFAEFRKMNIPGASCCPNGELALRIDDLVPDSSTPIVINCAGRTRSIIGAQTLIHLGLPNPVHALENGTQGWMLADFELEHGAQRRADGPQAPAPRPEQLAARSRRARDWARSVGVMPIGASDLPAELARNSRSVFLCDVRSAEEYAAGHMPGAEHTPGGQLVQATDQYIGVRGARIIVVDEEEVRAPVAAAWLHLMGLDVCWLAGGFRGVSPDALEKALAAPHRVKAPSLAVRRLITAAEIAEMPARERRLIDLRPSMNFRAAHLAGARWSIRPRLARDLQALGPGPVTLIASDARIAALAAQDALEAGATGVSVCCEPEASWREAGLAVVTQANTRPRGNTGPRGNTTGPRGNTAADGSSAPKSSAAPKASVVPQPEPVPEPEPVPVPLTAPSDAECIDYLFFTHDRHDGNKAAARQYLAWELGLVDQIDADERAMFRLPVLSGRV